MILFLPNEAPLHWSASLSKDLARLDIMMLYDPLDGGLKCDEGVCDLLSGCTAPTKAGLSLSDNNTPAEVTLKANLGLGLPPIPA